MRKSWRQVCEPVSVRVKGKERYSYALAVDSCRVENVYEMNVCHDESDGIVPNQRHTNSRCVFLVFQISANHADPSSLPFIAAVLIWIRNLLFMCKETSRTIEHVSIIQGLIISKWNEWKSKNVYFYNQWCKFSLGALVNAVANVVDNFNRSLKLK